MEEPQKIEPQYIVNLSVLMAYHLQQYLELKDHLFKMLLQVEWSEDDPEYIRILQALTLNANNMPWMIAKLEEMRDSAIEDIQEGLRYYNKREKRELTHEELVRMVDEDMPY